MIVRSNSWTARTALSAGALTLAAIIFGGSASARVATMRQWCFSNCSIGDHHCFVLCDQMFPKNKAFIARRPTSGTSATTQPTAPRPIAGTGATTQPTRLNR